MSHPLDGAWAKVARAEEHFDALKTKIGEPSDHTDAITFRQEFDPDSSTIKVTLEGVPELPVEWALIAADGLQNLRAALNYLTWELARWNLVRNTETRIPHRNTQFPINSKAREFSGHMVVDLHPDHVAIIKSLQPNSALYLSQFTENFLLDLPMETLTAGSPLATLARLTNTDKHEVLQPALIQPSGIGLGPYVCTDCEITMIYVNMGRSLENRAEWVAFDLSVTGPKPEVQVDDKITPQVAFGGWNVDASGHIIGSVKEIIRIFEPVF
jgi:hypothetical protein